MPELRRPKPAQLKELRREPHVLEDVASNALLCQLPTRLSQPVALTPVCVRRLDFGQGGTRGSSRDSSDSPRSRST
jgi:hypothetical protein